MSTREEMIEAQTRFADACRDKPTGDTSLEIVEARAAWIAAIEGHTQEEVSEVVAEWFGRLLREQTAS